MLSSEYVWTIEFRLPCLFSLAPSDGPVATAVPSDELGLDPCVALLEVVEASQCTMVARGTLKKELLFDANRRDGTGLSDIENWEQAGHVFPPSRDPDKFWDLNLFAEYRMYHACSRRLRAFAARIGDAALLSSLRGKRQNEAVHSITLEVAGRKATLRLTGEFMDGTVGPMRLKPDAQELQRRLAWDIMPHETFALAADDAMRHHRFGDVVANLMAMLEVAAHSAFFRRTGRDYTKTISMKAFWGVHVLPALNCRPDEGYAVRFPDSFASLLALEGVRNAWLHRGQLLVRRDHMRERESIDPKDVRLLQHQDAINLRDVAHHATEWLLRRAGLIPE